MPLKSWSLLATRVLQSRLGNLHRPYKMTFVVTKSCHSRCQNCSIWQTKVENELTLEEIRKIAPRLGFLSWIDFTGGEPSDRPDFVEIVKTFVDSNPNLQLVHFPTNGLATERISRMAKEIRSVVKGRFIVTVSIDGPPEVNAVIRGIPNGFHRSLETYKRLREIEGVEAFIGMTLYASNASLIDETVTEIQKVIPDFHHEMLHVNLGHTSEHYYENNGAIVAAESAISKAISELEARRGFAFSPFSILEKAYHRGLREYLATKKTPVECASLMSSFFLSEKGVVYPCSIWDVPLGDVRDFDYDIGQILDRSETRKARKEIREGKCIQCWTPCEAYQSIAASWP